MAPHVQHGLQPWKEVYMTRAITARQRAILEYIADAIQAEGYPPTIQEIGAHFGIASTNGVHDHLATLERKGYIERSSKARSIRITQKASAGLVRRETGALPLVGRVAAGQPLLAMENIEGYVAVSAKLAAKDAFCLRVTGDSMIDAGILDGDILVVDRERQPKIGDIVVALVDNEATVKYFHPKRDQIELRPANPRYAPMRYPAENVLIQGVAAALQRELD